MSEGSEETGAVREASAESALAEKLDVPSSPRGIYLDEVSVYRPILTGDIFRSVRVPGSSDVEASHNLTMIVAHPSVMRDGSTLTDRAKAAPVVPIGGVRKTHWTPDRFDIFPLPCLKSVCESNGFPDVTNLAWAADLRLSGPVDTDLLDVGQRVACLSPEGVLLLLQRFVHTDTRAAVRLDTLESVFLSKLEEVELLETWTEDVLTAHPPDDLATGLAACAAEFDAFLESIHAPSGLRLRDMLNNSLQRGIAQKAVLAEIERRIGG